jgi:hypothetical protein
MKLPMSMRFNGSGVEEVRLLDSLMTVVLMWKKRDALGLSDFISLHVLWRFCHSGVYGMKLPMCRRSTRLVWKM